MESSRINQVPYLRIEHLDLEKYMRSFKSIFIGQK
jgi:hypothetical protein